MFECRYVG
jgi:hypothetical protein